MPAPIQNLTVTLPPSNSVSNSSVTLPPNNSVTATVVRQPVATVSNVGTLPSPQVAVSNSSSLISPQTPMVVPTILTSPMEGSYFKRLKFRQLCLFDHILDQVASMLGADQWEDLPLIDQERVKITVNQAYRECYAPIDGHRPRWASRKMTVDFPEGVQSIELDTDVIDVEKVPVLVGHGPLSPMNARTDEVSARSHYSGDFRPVGGYQGNFPSYDMDEPEIDRPIWYYVDQVDTSEDFMVYPKLVLYPVPDIDYQVELVANIIPEDLQLGDSPRLPGEVCWDILLPIAQYKLLTDPRYNGANKELIVQSAREARRKLKHFSSPQKQRTIRIIRRGGW